MANQVILLIEPETTVRDLLFICLGKLGGWNVFPAVSIGHGRDWLIAQQPDVIVLSVALPEEDSLRFIDDLSHNLATARIPVVLLVSHATWLPSSRLSRKQVVGAIAKPFNPITLPIEIASLLGWPLTCDLYPPSRRSQDGSA